MRQPDRHETHTLAHRSRALHGRDSISGLQQIPFPVLAVAVAVKGIGTVKEEDDEENKILPTNWG